MDIAAFIVTVIFAGLVCSFGDAIGRGCGLIDRPDGRRKLHARATPLVGGIAIALPVASAAFWYGATTEFTPLFVTIGVVVLAFLILGLADDRHHTPPVWRLLLALGICIGAMTAIPGLRVEFVRFSFIYRVFLLDGWSVFFTLLCLIGLVNAINMADGKNGLLPGLVLVWLVLMLAEAPPHVMPLLLVAFAAVLVVFLFNVTGRVFLGDSGSYALGAFLGFLAIHIHDARVDWLPSDRVAIWFLIPIVDCLRLMARRILLGNSPFTPDRNHLHHVLYDAMPWRYGLILYLSLAALPALASAAMPRYTLLWAMIAIGLYAGLLALLPRLAATLSRSQER